MSRSINHIILWCGLVALVAPAVGCQRGPTWNLTPVEGTVTKNGRPLAGIQVVFLPDRDTVGPRSIGLTDEAGHYRMRTDNSDDGVVVGKHRVVFLDPEAAKGRIGHTADKPRLPEIAKRLEEPRKTVGDAPRVLPSYGSFNNTPLRAEVHPGPQTLDFDIH